VGKHWLATAFRWIESTAMPVEICDDVVIGAGSVVTKYHKTWYLYRSQLDILIAIYQN
jgi:acetyltransferase-like isoleucine patch superfamily enzyme